MLIRYRQHLHLYRRKPEWEGSFIVFYDHSHKSLKRSEYGDVDDNYFVKLAVFTNIVHIKIFWLVEVELDSRKLPFTTKRIFGSKIYFWTIKRSLTFDDRVFDSPFLDWIYKYFFCFLPRFIATKILFFIFWISD